ncbi:arylamine N-acetyltransferase [Stappia sp. F7233]|uniref:Arylamine N-acetyltransferase n=1 Tax=Stappia albiluteola TaxID=2758565 RepID=A0A839AM02_9HYPH|nr:arylamine N-acetyltransferase [Stappia albiluteola]MBA5779459.1 arylamine N-acetyltransferase [Stappia albiluteola]
MPFDLFAYLKRIGQAEIACDKDGLFALQEGQLASIPFENLDPLLGVVPDLELSSIFRKTVLLGRGGYCFELNTLLEAAMLALGFPVRRSLARVRMGAASGGPRSHLLLLTEIDGHRYLADAGFGGPGSKVPLALDTQEEQVAPNGSYRIVRDPHSGESVVERRTDTGWFALYGFDEAFVGDMDVVAANYLCATWPGAPFRDHLMLNGYDGSERIGVFDLGVTVETTAGQRRREFEGFDDFAETLTTRIGITLEAETLQTVWDRIGKADRLRQGDENVA